MKAESQDLPAKPPGAAVVEAEVAVPGHWFLAEKGVFIFLIFAIV